MNKMKCPFGDECTSNICIHILPHEQFGSCKMGCDLVGKHVDGCVPTPKTVTVVRYVNLKEFRENIGGVDSFRTSDKRSALFNHKITMTVETRITCPTCGIEIKEGMI